MSFLFFETTAGQSTHQATGRILDLTDTTSVQVGTWRTDPNPARKTEGDAPYLRWTATYETPNTKRTVIVSFADDECDIDQGVARLSELLHQELRLAPAQATTHVSNLRIQETSELT